MGSIISLMQKHTGKFIVLIVGIIIFAHAVIPHHHHFDSIADHLENLECETTNSKGHSENPDTHCHFLNIIVLEKTSDILVFSSTVSHLHFDLFNIETKPYIALNINDFIYIGCFDFSLQNQIFFTNHPLRAPPATV